MILQSKHRATGCRGLSELSTRIPLMRRRRATLPNRARLRHGAPPLKGGVLLHPAQPSPARPGQGMQSAITGRVDRRCGAHVNGGVLAPTLRPLAPDWVRLV